MMMKSPRSPSVDESAPTEDVEPQKALDLFASAVEQLTHASALLASSGSIDGSQEMYRALQEIPVIEGDQNFKSNKKKRKKRKREKLNVFCLGLLLQAGSFLLKSEQMRSTTLAQLNTDFSIPMKQFLRVDVAGVHEMQDRVEGERK
jgi:hypothetical protein